MRQVRTLTGISGLFLKIGDTEVIDSSGKIDYLRLKNVPSSFEPMVHDHDDLYYRKSFIDDHLANKNNPHGVTKAQVGLGNVANVLQASKTEFDTHVANTSNPHQVTKAQVGLGSVANVLQASKLEFDNHATNTTIHITQTERDKWNANSSDLGAHALAKNNPHGVTKSQVGLGNVDNIQQATKTEFNSHVNNKSNPHGVTKSQVGLGNVSNVLQASKTEFDSHKTDIAPHQYGGKFEWKFNATENSLDLVFVG